MQLNIATMDLEGMKFVLTKVHFITNNLYKNKSININIDGS